MNIKAQKILVIAGGTGGHIFPALAVAEALTAQGVTVEWMGAETGMEKKLVSERYPIHFLPVKGMRGKNLTAKIVGFFYLLRAFMRAIRIILKINPDAVLGMGGYASGPGGMAAWLLRKKLVIHEQNAKAGLTNRILARFAAKTYQAFPDALPKAETVGNPVRAVIRLIAHPQNYYQQRQEPWRILILGGSQGARFINQLLMDFVLTFEDRQSLLLWHQTGVHDFEKVKSSYAQHENFPHRIAPFIEKIEEAYAWADCVIARAGALTVSEVATVGLPTIFIPFPAAVDDHQYYNAKFIASKGGGVVFRESEITVKKLEDCLKTQFLSKAQLEKMSQGAQQAASPNATERVIEGLLVNPRVGRIRA